MKEKLKENIQQNSPFSLGLKLSDINDDVLDGVQGIYEKIAGIKIRKESVITSEILRKNIEIKGNIERRFGSSLSPHSKLYIERDYSMAEDKIYRFRFSDNQDEDIESGKEMVSAFRNAVNNYLTEKELETIK